ncbi:MAG: serpin family protein [Candidatus Methylacidiphilales bacterium]|nr:serpin family protein [Candidatus Methylacidiphilales bacterium]
MKSPFFKSQRPFLRLTLSLVLLVLGPQVMAVRAQSPAVPNSREESAAAKASNAFAFDVLNALKSDTTQSGNVAFSPFNLWSALTMTSGGAAGDTLKEMQKALHADSLRDVHVRAGELTAQLQATPGTELRIANRLFAAPGLALVPAFDELLKKHYGTEISRVPFSSDPRSECNQINKWVAGQTANKIQRLLRPSQISADTPLILVNAIYFKAFWESPFRPHLTLPYPFTRASGKIMKSPMMSSLRDMPYFETTDFQAVRLEYKGGKTSCTLLLSGKGRKVSLTAALFEKIQAGFTTQKVALKVPRFTLEQQLDCVPILQSLGMKLPFSKKQADFSAMGTLDVKVRKSLYLDAVAHEAFVKVNEEGTEATAATTVKLVPVCMPPPETAKPKEFIADRPFYFFITQEETGVILFMGKVDKPDLK